MMDKQVPRERWRLLHQIVRLLEVPMTVLGFIWIVLLLIDMIRGLHGRLAVFSEVIWVLFGLDFALELFVAPNKRMYLKRHWPVAVSLVVPALRIVRFVRVVHVARAATMSFGNTLAALNRGLAALGATMRRRGFAYVMVVTLAVIFVGAAGIYDLEDAVPDPQGIHDYGAALWWTAMLMTTLGPTSWPVTVGGRVLCFFLGLYAFTIFGYVAATLATFFIDRDADRPDAAVAGQRSIDALHARLDALQRMLEARLPASIDDTHRTRPSGS
jgi:voltage-gated potassium channel